MMLRFANIIGPGIRTALTDHFTLPVVPTVMGYDGRLQFVHEDDAVEAMRLATVGSATGIVNVAGDGVLLVSQAARLAGRPVLPVPPALSGAAGALLRRTGLTDFSREQMRFLSFGRALDTTRMRRLLGLEPRYTTRAAFEDFVRGRRLDGPLSADRVQAAEQAVLDVLDRVAGAVAVPVPATVPAAVPAAGQGGAP
jgi:UDP-glucose 4-epimerase